MTCILIYLCGVLFSALARFCFMFTEAFTASVLVLCLPLPAHKRVSNYVSTAPDVNVFAVLHAELTSSSTFIFILKIIYVTISYVC